MPIRLNSKRVPGKSVKLLGGRPLFCWLAEELDHLGIPVHIFSTSPETLQPLLDFVPRNIVFTQRPAYLDGDQVKGIEIYRSFAELVPADGYLLCHATSPFIRAATLRRVIGAVAGGEWRCSLVVKKIQTFAWYSGKPLNFGFPRTQTQKLEPLYVETSAAYCYRRELLQETGDRSDASPHLVEAGWPENEDIDDPADFERCEAFARALRLSGSRNAD